MSFGSWTVVGFGAVIMPSATITLSSNVNNYNLANDLTNNYGWNGSDAITVDLNINSDVTVYSTGTSTPSLVVNLVSGSVLTINNSGSIVGKGGAAGSSGTGAGGAGGAGGAAMSMQDVTVTINNASGAKIQGGGGGGGGGGGSTHQGSATDGEGVCQNGTSRNGGGGGTGAGLANATAAAGSGGTGAGPAATGDGGNGGAFGAAGSNGTASNNSGCKVTNGAGGAGGAAGKAINHVSGVLAQTINNSGTVAGATS